MPLTSLRAALPVCLLFGSLCTIFPASANPAFAGTVETRELPLLHVTPVDIVHQMHWDQTRDFPDGVTQIQADTKKNALSVMATPAGFAGLKELVRLLDIAPRRVKIKFVLARATATDLEASGLHGLSLVPLAPVGAAPAGFVGMASGGPALSLLKLLIGRKAVLQSPTLTTTNNGDALLSVSGSSVLAGWSSFTLAATPRVNSDNTVTLRLHPSISKCVAAKPGGSPVTTTQELQTLRTVKSAETLVLIDLFPQSVKTQNSAKTQSGSLVMFVTPTVLPQ